jgi:hypothetical protein
MSTAKKEGQVNADEAAFVETILTAVAPDMTLEEVVPSARVYLELLGIPLCTARRGLKVGAKKTTEVEGCKGK